MPSHAFQLTRTEAIESLPEYTPVPFDAVPQRLSTILEMDEEDEEAGVAKPRFWTSWEMKNLLSVEYATMVPQALLVDASTTLCTYLYFTSLQARMALQHKTTLDVLSTICASMPDDADALLLARCYNAISQFQANASFDLNTISHRLAIGLVLLKALAAFALLRYGSRYVRPFDYLVASGASHCLVLYGLFFVPVANLLSDGSISGAAVWIRIVNKVFWLLAVVAIFTVVHWSAKVAFKSARRVQLPALETSLVEKDANDLA